MSDDRRVDDLRQQLRSLGYLDAGVDRFVLAPAVRSRRPAAIALLASLRSGIIAAALLGPAAAVGVAARFPTLVISVRDALVVAFYLAVLFGAAVVMLSFGASLAVSWLARIRDQNIAPRGRVLSTIAGALVAAACLTYLTLWWYRAMAAGYGAAGGTAAWIAIPIALAVAISLVLGYLVTLTTRAILVASVAADGEPPRRPDRSWKAAVGLGVLAFSGAVVLLVLTVRSEAARGGPNPWPVAVTSPGGRIWVIAIDGFDPSLVHDLTRVTSLPALSSAFSQARAELEAEDSRDPARVWTTIATGQPPEVHGVRELETRRVAGIQGSLPSGRPWPFARSIRAATDLLRLTTPAIASGNERRERTFWEVAARAGLRTVVINWWATWPAPVDSGVVLSDRAVLRLEKGGTLNGEIAPTGVYEDLLRRWPNLLAEARRRASDALHGGPALDSAVATLLQRSAELDALQLALGNAVEGQADLVALYLPGLDIAQHTLLGSSDEGPVAASSLSMRLDALKHYYVALDRLLANVLSSETTGVFVVTQPGRVATRENGLLAMSGRLAAQTTTVARSVDVAPTILRALGVPMSKALAGQPIAFFNREFEARYPIRYMATYGRPATRATVQQGQPMDEEMIERLRSLGYVR